jgi:hypothetical protein
MSLNHATFFQLKSVTYVYESNGLKYLIRIERLHEERYQLRRLEADLLRVRIYELRVSFKEFTIRSSIFSRKYRCCVVSWNHKRGLCSSDKIDRAIKCHKNFEMNLKAHI